jgi:hypothetical protein
VQITHANKTRISEQNKDYTDKRIEALVMVTYTAGASDTNSFTVTIEDLNHIKDCMILGVDPATGHKLTIDNAVVTFSGNKLTVAKSEVLGREFAITNGKAFHILAVGQ